MDRPRMILRQSQDEWGQVEKNLTPAFPVIFRHFPCSTDSGRGFLTAETQRTRRFAERCMAGWAPGGIWDLVFMVAMGHAGCQGGNVRELGVTSYELGGYGRERGSRRRRNDGVGVRLGSSRECLAFSNASCGRDFDPALTFLRQGGGNN